MKIVMKFGGTSVADGDRMRRCAVLLKENSAGHQVVAVVSALDGMTEELWRWPTRPGPRTIRR